MATDVTQRPLPTEVDFSDPNRTSAYTIVLRAEKDAQNPRDLMSARVVGFMLLEFRKQAHIFQSDTSCSTLVKWVTSPPTEKGASDRDVVHCLGELLREKFIRIFRTSPARYQPPSSHSSRFSFDTLEDMIKDTLEPTDRRQTSSREKALARDGFRCMVTGIFNENSVEKLKKSNREHQIGSKTVKSVIETAHILNESTIHGIDPEGIAETSIPNKTEYAATAMAMLKAFGFPNLTEAFRRSGGVHQAWNLLSLENNCHRNFDRLNLWFEHTEKPHRYRVCVSDEGMEIYIHSLFRHPEPHVDGAPMVVEFNSKLEDAPPPHPFLLALHATCARVAHMAGAAEYFDKLERDEEDIKVLARDGSNAVLLSHLLSPFGILEAENYAKTAA